MPQSNLTQRLTQEIPPFVRPFLWSYDVDRMDLRAHKERIITNVLNYGTSEAVAWLRRTYTPEEIRAVVAAPRAGEWNKKSLAFWQLIYNLPRNAAPQRRITTL